MTIYFFSIFFGTFLLEDLALATSILFVAEHKLTIAQAFLACFFGIAIGDLLLYLLGYSSKYFIAKVKNDTWIKYFSSLEKINKSEIFAYTIFFCRAIPGTRLPTYLCAGISHFSFIQFFLITLVSVFLWLSIAFGLGQGFLKLGFSNTLILLVAVLVTFKLVKRLIPIFFNSWTRKSFFVSWKKYFHFEFWPAWIFYLPIVPYYIYFSIKYRGVLHPFYANPEIYNGGLIGESKWDFLKHLQNDQSYNLKAAKFSNQMDENVISTWMQSNQITFPFIAKPDIGQRGYGVRIIRNWQQLKQYFEFSKGDIILQQKSNFVREAGLFYIRLPKEPHGNLFSITDKEFPFVVGDGINPLGDLILKDKRARYVSGVYFDRHKNKLETVIPKGEIFILAECGNHCQGAIFKNGIGLYSDELRHSIEELANNIPNFYFGRIDIRYSNMNELIKGKGFEVIEINGAGSEATHIWDEKTKLLEAYIILFKQWDFLFKIGHQVRTLSLNRRPASVVGFLKEVLRVINRKDELSTSS